jgi:hypothetical protein
MWSASHLPWALVSAEKEGFIILYFVPMFLQNMHICISIYQHINLSIYQYINISIYQYINISIYQYINISKYQYINISIYQYININMYIHKYTVIYIYILCTRRPGVPPRGLSWDQLLRGCLGFHLDFIWGS